MERLTRLSDEEKLILGGQTDIRKDDYTQSDAFIVNSKKLLSGEKQIDLRLHTRFIDFPEHGHDYMEFMYVYAGSVTHVIGGEKIALQSGDILFLNRHIRHSVLRAEREDVGINFIVSDAFLKYIFHNVENNSIMSEFLTRNFDPDGEGEYLCFQTKDNFPIRCVMDCLIYSLVRDTKDDHALLVQLVALLLSYLAYYKETLANALKISSPDALLRQQVSAYIRGRYPDASLAELAAKTGYNKIYLSKKIRRLFGANFTELLQKERLNVSAKLLRTTQLSVDEIIRTVGYENQTHFHNLFKRMFGTSPRRYKISHTKDKTDN